MPSRGRPGKRRAARNLQEIRVAKRYAADLREAYHGFLRSHLAHGGSIRGLVRSSRRASAGPHDPDAGLTYSLFRPIRQPRTSPP